MSGAGFDGEPVIFQRCMQGLGFAKVFDWQRAASDSLGRNRRVFPASCCRRSKRIELRVWIDIQAVAGILHTHPRLQRRLQCRCGCGPDRRTSSCARDPAVPWRHGRPERRRPARNTEPRQLPHKYRSPCHRRGGQPALGRDWRRGLAKRFAHRRQPPCLAKQSVYR